MTMRPQPLLSVADVDAAGAFYAKLLGGHDDHGGRHGGSVREYGRIEVGGRLVLQLHLIGEEHHHGALAEAGVPLGNGIAVWFATDEFDAAVERVRSLGAEIVHDVHVNPNARQREIWLRDPDGYLVVLAEGDGGAAIKARTSSPRSAQLFRSLSEAERNRNSTRALGPGVPILFAARAGTCDTPPHASAVMC